MLPFISAPCCICGTTIHHNKSFCETCEKFVLKNSRYCETCGTFKPTEAACSLCIDKTFYFDRFFSPFIFAGAIAQVIREMKYTPSYNQAVSIGNLLAANIPDNFLTVDYITFPPMTKRDLLKRGFNQAAVVAQQVARKHSIPLKTNIFKKIRHTAPQAELSIYERNKNLINAFSVKPVVKNKSLLIIDDVATTLSTLNTLADLSKKNSSSKVFCITAARKSSYFI